MIATATLQTLKSGLTTEKEIEHRANLRKKSAASQPLKNVKWAVDTGLRLNYGQKSLPLQASGLVRSAWPMDKSVTQINCLI